MSGAALIIANQSSVRVDPMSFSLEQLAAIRGAMWSVRWNGPLGPRPGQPTNILAMDYYEWHGDIDRKRMIEIYKSRGYTHAVTGPLVDGGYHGLYPAQPTVPTQAQFDHYLDCMQEWWDVGIKPVHFVHPDGWTFEQTHDQLTTLYRQPRAQRLLRIIVPSGWEPTKYDWSSVTWALFCRWARETFQNALVLIHTVSDVDAPVGTDARYDDNGKPNADGWARVVPHLHGWLIQNGPYPTGPSRAANRDDFANQFRQTVSGSLWQRFHQGYAGWPQFSAWGQGQPIKLYNAECTAYESFWHDLPESETRQWGDLAMQSGADGFLDGGNA